MYKHSLSSGVCVWVSSLCALRWAFRCARQNPYRLSHHPCERSQLQHCFSHAKLWMRPTKWQTTKNTLVAQMIFSKIEIKTVGELWAERAPSRGDVPDVKCVRVFVLQSEKLPKVICRRKMSENWRRCEPPLLYALVLYFWFAICCCKKSPDARNVLASNYYYFLIKKFSIRKQQEHVVDKGDFDDDDDDDGEYDVGDQPSNHLPNQPRFIHWKRSPVDSSNALLAREPLSRYEMILNVNRLSCASGCLVHSTQQTLQSHGPLCAVRGARAMKSLIRWSARFCCVFFSLRNIMEISSCEMFGDRTNCLPLIRFCILSSHLQLRRTVANTDTHRRAIWWRFQHVLFHIVHDFH